MSATRMALRPLPLIQLAPESVRAGAKLALGRRPVEVSRPITGDNDDRGSRRQHGAEFQPIALTHAALETIAYDSVAYTARNRNTEPRTFVIGAVEPIVKHEMPALIARPAPLQLEEFPRIAQPIRSAEPRER